MKQTLIIILLLFHLYGKYSERHSQEYIQIQFTGITQYSSKQLFIVKEKIAIETIEKQLAKNKLKTKHPLTKRETTRTWDALFNTMVTDSITFSKIEQFVNSNKELLNKKGSQFLISINDVDYEIALKSENEFFSKLLQYLESENCDNSVIKKLNTYLNENASNLVLEKK